MTIFLNFPSVASSLEFNNIIGHRAKIWWPRRTLSVVHIDPDTWILLPTFVFRRTNPSPDVHLAPTYVFRLVNPSPDVRFPDAWTCPDVRFPMREPFPTFVFRRVNPSPDVRFPTRETFETVSLCDSYWSFNAFFQHVKSFNMRSRPVKHTDVSRRVRTSTLLKIRVAWGVRYAPLANGADEHQRQSLAIAIFIVRVTAETSQYACAI